MIKKTISAIFTILLIALAILWIWEYSRIQKGLNPKFCLKNNEYTYDDGKTYECVGLGYNVYKYERTSINAIEFSPFFVKMKE